ncbi:UNVERIFIED_CONTAM: hypothetical protein PYX00_002953 [Menopon gallinae]|uniref:Uncharacterized protein n=1 Tax=Menopon gallinae TaxID=328185 RepID=A0AAW2HYK4_9NEOP
MANSGEEEFCRLCLCCKLIKLESLQKNDILNKVSKYLFIKMEQNSVALCVNCYNSLEDFHRFYEGVHSAQKKFHALQKAEAQAVPVKTITQANRSDSESYDNKVYDDLYANCDSSRTDEEKEDVPDEKAETDKPAKRGKLKEVLTDIEKKMMEFYNIKCEKCKDVKFSSFKMLSRHYSTVHNTQGYIKCCKRNIRVNDKSYLRSHMLRHLEPDSCRCTVCGKQLSSAVTLKHHMILHKPTEERPFQCSECEKRFCCKNDLKNHEKAIHVPESEREDFICDVCGKVFQKVANLRYHHSTVHLQERKYVCELCAKTFTTQSGLKTHRNAAHSTTGPIQCPECNKWLKNEDTFQKHQQLHQNNTFPCSQCSKICNSSASLRSHMVKHSEERPYSCVTCRKSFKTKTHLKNHSLQHSGASNYKCPFCSRMFVNMSNYYTHRKRMHYNKDAAKDGSNEVQIKNQEMYINSENMGRKESENNFDYDLREYETGMPQAGNEVCVVRQNIIISPGNVKYI